MPVGAFLSGGIDSSAVVATMAAADAGPGQDLLDRLRRSRVRRAGHAREVAARVRHRSPRAGAAARRRADRRGPRVVSRRAVRRHVGDPDLHGVEAGGRARQGRADRRRRRRAVRRLRQVRGRGPRARATTACRPRCGRLAGAVGRRDARGHERPPVPAASRARRRRRAISTRRRCSAPTRCASCSSPTRSSSIAATTRCGGVAVASRGTGDDWLSAVQYRDLQTYLPLDILTKVDRMTMAHSIEARPPLLDHRLVEFAATIPARFRLRDGTTKYLLKQAMRGILPDGIIDRPKQGFAVPLARWFRGELAGVRPRRAAVRHLPRSAASSNAGYVERLLQLNERGRDLDLQLWTMLSFELWCRRFLDRGVAAARTSAAQLPTGHRGASQGAAPCRASRRRGEPRHPRRPGRAGATASSRRSRGDGYRVAFVPINPRFPRGLRLAAPRAVSPHARQPGALPARACCGWPRSTSCTCSPRRTASFLLAPVPAMLAARALGKRVVLHYHSGEADDHLAHWGALVHPWLRLADEIVVPSAYLRDVFARHGYRRARDPERRRPVALRLSRAAPAAAAAAVDAQPRAVLPGRRRSSRRSRSCRQQRPGGDADRGRLRQRGGRLRRCAAAGGDAASGSSARSTRRRCRSSTPTPTSS